MRVACKLLSYVTVYVKIGHMQRKLIEIRPQKVGFGQY